MEHFFVLFIIGVWSAARFTADGEAYKMFSFQATARFKISGGRMPEGFNQEESTLKWDDIFGIHRLRNYIACLRSNICTVMENEARTGKHEPE